MTIVVISGPSGVGKNTVVAAALAQIPALRLGASLTTRQPRPNDVAGKYTYVSRPEFKAQVAKGEVLEWAEYNGELYGTLRPHTSGPILLEIEVQGAAQIKQQYPDALLVFMVTPGRNVKEQLEVLAKRLRLRGTDHATAIESRLARAKAELIQGQAQSDVIIVNDNLEAAVNQTVQCLQEYLAKKS